MHFAGLLGLKGDDFGLGSRRVSGRWRGAPAPQSRPFWAIKRATEKTVFAARLLISFTGLEWRGCVYGDLQLVLGSRVYGDLQLWSAVRQL